MFNYKLGLNSSHTTPEVESELIDILDLSALSEASVCWPALTVSVDDREGMYQPSFEMYSEELGAPVTSVVFFSTDNTAAESDWEMAKNVMFQSALRLVERLDCSAVFFFQSDRVLMRRLKGQLYLSTLTKWWTRPEVASYVPGTAIFVDDLDSMVPAPDGL